MSETSNPAPLKVFSLGDKITLSPQDAASLKKMKDGQVALQQFTSLIVRQGEERVKELMSEGHARWTAIANANGLDLATQNWELSQDGNEIVLKGVRVNG